MSARAKLVAAIDFSVGSIQAVKWTAGWLLSDRDLVLAHVLIVPDRNDNADARTSIPDSLMFNAHVGARRRLDDLRKSLGFPNARLEIGEGKPARAISEIAKSTGADLIVVGKHGETGPLRGYTGRTADSLVKSASVPTIVVNGSFTGAPTRIVVAMTYSSITPHIVEWTRRLQENSGARVTVIHVIGSGTLSHVLSLSAVKTGEPPTSEEIDEIFSEDRERWVTALVDAGVPQDCIDSEVIFGEVSTAILSAQETLGADMIIMGSHAGPIRRLLLGSSASAVIRNAEIPVMVVVEPDEVSAETMTTAGATAGAGVLQ
jgi:nucleotide-binding universal stress UspA family protein